MGQQEERFCRSGPAQPRDEIPFSRIRPEHLHVARGEPGGLQPRRDRIRSPRHVAARRVGRVDLDELLENLPRPLTVGSRLRRDEAACQEDEKP